MIDSIIPVMSLLTMEIERPITPMAARAIWSNRNLLVNILTNYVSLKSQLNSRRMYDRTDSVTRVINCKTRETLLVDGTEFLKRQDGNWSIGYIDPIKNINRNRVKKQVRTSKLGTRTH